MVISTPKHRLISDSTDGRLYLSIAATLLGNSRILVPFWASQLINLKACNAGRFPPQQIYVTNRLVGLFPIFCQITQMLIMPMREENQRVMTRGFWLFTSFTTVALTFGETRTSYASGREICVPTKRNRETNAAFLNVLFETC